MNKDKIPAKKDTATYDFWAAQIDLAKESKRMKKFHSTGHEIECVYRDEHDSGFGGAVSRYNILYSNTETILPILFSESPKVDVRACDVNSVNNRLAAKMLEDELESFVQVPETYGALERCVKDMLLSGMGCSRVKYKPYFEEREVDYVDDDGFQARASQEFVVMEEAQLEHIYWKDILFPDVKDWDSLPWMAYRGLYEYAEACEIFGKKSADALEYVYCDDSGYDSSSINYDNDHSSSFNKALVWEIWFKEERKVIWFSSGDLLRSPLLIEDDPLELEGFFPSPKPMMACSTNNTIIPRALFVQYQDLADELNEITTRIRSNVANLKRRGIYDSSFPELQDLVTADDNVFKGSQDFARLSDKGGLKAVMDTEDLTQQIAVVQALSVRQKEVIGSIYEIMGYADILRGVSDPRETASAQRIKGKFGTLRISKMQREVQRFVRDCIRLMGELVINKFEAKSIALTTGVPIAESERYLEILRQVTPKSVLVDIQTDSTVAADEIADKESIVEFVGAVTSFAERSPLMVQSIGLEATSQILLMMLDKFKVGRNIEQAILDQVKKLQSQEKASQNKPKEPNPEQIKAQSDLIKSQSDAAKVQAEMQAKMIELQLRAREIAVKEKELGIKAVDNKVNQDLKALEAMTKALAVEAEAESAGNDFVGV